MTTEAMGIMVGTPLPVEAGGENLKFLDTWLHRILALFGSAHTYRELHHHQLGRNCQTNDREQYTY